MRLPRACPLACQVSVSPLDERHACPLRRNSCIHWFLRGALPRMCANFFSCKMFRPFQGRSSVVEQRPFKPKVVGSIPTAPTIHLSDGWTFNKNTRGQKGADWTDDPVPLFFSAARVTTGRAISAFNTSSNPVWSPRSKAPESLKTSRMPLALRSIENLVSGYLPFLPTTENLAGGIRMKGCG